MKQDLQDLLDLVTPEIVIQIMKENGSDVFDRTVDRRTNQPCLWFKTICHGGDSHKLCFFTKTKDFFCYTNCGRMKFSYGIKKIRNIQDGEFGKVIEYINQKVGRKRRVRNKVAGKIGSREIREELSELEELAEYKKRKEKAPVAITTFFDESILKHFEHNKFYQGWIDEGISFESMEKFEICWYEFQKAIIIPHRNIEGKLVGIRRRSLLPENQKSNKYMPLFCSQVLYDHPLSLNLYGLYENQNAIKKQRKAIITEGEKSVLLSDTYYGDKSITVSTCGFNISDYQINLLLKLGVEDVIIAFDKDYDINKIEEYKKDSSLYSKYCNYINKLRVLSSRLLPFCSVSLLLDKSGLLEEKDSPFDKGKSTLEQLIKSRTKITSSLDNKIFEVCEGY